MQNSCAEALERGVGAKGRRWLGLRILWICGFCGRGWFAHGSGGALISTTSEVPEDAAKVGCDGDRGGVKCAWVDGEYEPSIG